MTKNPETWQLVTENEHVHTVTAVRHKLRWTVRWERDGVEIASRRTFDSTPVLDGKELGALRLQLSSVFGCAQEVALHLNRGGEEGMALAEAVFAHRGDGLQFAPEPGGRAETQLKWMDEHPVQYLAAQGGLAAAGLLVPLALAALAGLIVWQLNVPTPGVPDLPNLPDLPLPDLPSLPGWVGMVVPVVLAVLFGWFELGGARKQRSKQRSSKDF